MKLRAESELHGATVKPDWTMPVKKQLINGEPAFLQPRAWQLRECSLSIVELATLEQLGGRSYRANARFTLQD